MADIEYGINWDAFGNPHPLIRHLKCLDASFYATKRSKYALLPAWEHAEHACRMLWDNEDFAWAGRSELNGKVYENNYLPPIFRHSFDPMQREVVYTGPASSSKTFTCAALSLIFFYAAPEDTTVIVCSSSSRGADVRTWDAIKTLHESSKFKVGTPLEYLRAITMDRSLEETGKRDAATRKLKNGVLLMSLPEGGEGLRAAQNIKGIKNRRVILIIDELPDIPEGVWEFGVAALGKNPSVKIIGLGNAMPGNNPHRKLCEPKGGWDNHDPNNTEYGGTWKTQTGTRVVFLSGLKSPNMHPELFDAEDKSQLPFPYLISHFDIREDAKRFGGVNGWEAGMKTREFLAFDIGYWGSNTGQELTVLNRTEISERTRTKTRFTEPPRKVAALDPSFTGTGDEFVLIIGEIGTEYGTGELILQMPDEGEALSAPADGDFLENMARQVVEKLRANGIRPWEFGVDISSDGGKVFQAIAKEWGNADFHAISSTGKPSGRKVFDDDHRTADEIYDRQVTEHWMSIRQMVLAGRIRGFNPASRYARDIFERRYSLKGKMISLETKKDMKKRIGRSPDHGDSAVYLTWVARRNGVDALSMVEEEQPVQSFAEAMGSSAVDDGFGGIDEEMEFSLAI